MGETEDSAATVDSTWPFPRPPRRMGPLRRDERPAEAEELLRGMRVATTGDADGPDMNLFATLAHHPRLLKRWSAFGGTLLFRGELPDRDRELLILRTARNCGVRYEWEHHIPIARGAGLGDADIAHVVEGPEAAGLSEDDAVLLRAADELHRDNAIGEATWAALSARYSPAQLVELCMVVGQYHLVAFTVRSLGIQLEDHEDHEDAGNQDGER
jgi:alkylhydroperoxidase family enzyme